MRSVYFKTRDPAVLAHVLNFFPDLSISGDSWGTVLWAAVRRAFGTPELDDRVRWFIQQAVKKGATYFVGDSFDAVELFLPGAVNVMIYAEEVDIDFPASEPDYRLKCLAYRFYEAAGPGVEIEEYDGSIILSERTAS